MSRAGFEPQTFRVPGGDHTNVATTPVCKLVYDEINLSKYKILVKLRFNGTWIFECWVSVTFEFVYKDKRSFFRLEMIGHLVQLSIAPSFLLALKHNYR